MHRNRSSYAFRPLRQVFSTSSTYAKALRIVFVCCSLVASVAFAFSVLVHAHSAAHADPTLIQARVPQFNSSFNQNPWGIAVDGGGHVWAAEPQCDPNVGNVPICTNAIPTGILEYSSSGFNSNSSPMQKLQEPQGYSSPFFLVFDSKGDLWFTEPATNAIGEYDTMGNWNQWSVTTSGASPFDLTFDQFGHLWFTELSANKIGEFDPVTDKMINEFATPTPNSRPYGITGPDPTTHSIWFTENNATVHRIGQITPKSDGTISGSINEYLTNTAHGDITPHLITYDRQGHIWWSDGFAGTIGQLVISQASNGTNQGVTEYNVPAPSCSGSCGSHISGIAVDSTGTVWFDDSLSSRYGSFTPGTNTFNMYVIGGCVTGNSHPHDGLAVDGNNNIWISEEFGDNLDEALPGMAANPTPCSSPTTPVSSPTPSPSPTLTPTPTGTPPPPGPVNKQWYFAEGRVGGGFNEFLSLENPTSTTCQVNIEYLYTPDRGSSQTKIIQVSVAANSRYTEGVDGDLGTNPRGIGISDSAIVTVNNGVTPNCTGIVAERPMYFNAFGNALGVNSGSDVLGVSKLGTSFYIADVAVGSQPGGGSYASFLPILNPPGGQSATVIATYYSGGHQVGQQSLLVLAGTRGTIFPDNFSPALPAHVSVVVTSTQPVDVERPTYFSNINGGNAGTVSGGADVIGVQTLSSDWLFAEGYTGGRFQENFVLANLDKTANTTASVTITLEYPDGTTQQSTVSVPTLSQVNWNVNANVNPGERGQSVSAEITSSGAKIVAEREMFFYYNHNANGRSLSAVGGTDVLGQVGPAAFTTYTFAEGYTNVGYDEWLTLQNPTGTSETINVTLFNSVGNSYAFSVTVKGHSRGTVDIVNVVLHNLYRNGDGFKGFEVSMTVQTASGPFVAERPMYWNASNTQGGSDIIGYKGS